MIPIGKIPWFGTHPFHESLTATSFEAGVNIAFIEPDLDHTHVNFVAPLGNNWQVEASSTVGPSALWTPVADPVVGSDLFGEVVDEHAVVGQRYYRVRLAP